MTGSMANPWGLKPGGGTSGNSFTTSNWPFSRTRRPGVPPVASPICDTQKPPSDWPLKLSVTALCRVGGGVGGIERGSGKEFKQMCVRVGRGLVGGLRCRGAQVGWGDGVGCVGGERVCVYWAWMGL